LMTMMWGYLQQGIVTEQLGSNVFDSGSHFYDVYECADGKFVSVGAIEPHFFNNLVAAVGLDPSALPRRGDRSRWDESKQILGGVFRTRTRDEWCHLLEDQPDLCFSPVLTMSEAPRHPHHQARETFLEIEDVIQPAPSPRFGRTPGAVSRPPAVAGEHTDEVLREWLALDDAEVLALRAEGAAG